MAAEGESADKLMYLAELEPSNKKVTLQLHHRRSAAALGVAAC